MNGTNEMPFYSTHGTHVAGIIAAKAGNGGRLFGAVTSKEIADALQAQHGIAIPKTKIVQDEPIKAFGGYELKVKLGYEVTGTLKVVVAEA